MTDGDRLLDGEELAAGTDPNSTDSDEDGPSDYDELNVWATNPNNADSDEDGLSDSEEVQTHNTDPNNADSDEDGLSDSEEVSTYGTDPLENDSDHDGFDDPTEIDAGTNPTDAADFPVEEEKGCSSTGQSPLMWALPLGLLGLIRRRK